MPLKPRTIFVQRSAVSSAVPAVIPQKAYRGPHQKHTDPRITVSNAEDRKESLRQWQYISRHPECLLVPPKRSKPGPKPGTKKKEGSRPRGPDKKKRQKVESKGTK